MAKKNDNRIKITIYGYNVMDVEEATRMVSETLLQLKLVFGTISPKTRTRTATTLTSPHKHKKAQEKFEQKTHRRTIFISGTCPFDLKTLEQKIKPSIPNAAHLELKSIEYELKSKL